MIVDLAHVPLTQRRVDAPFNKISESPPLPENAVELRMPDPATADDNAPAAAAAPPGESPNHLPSDASPAVPENSDGDNEPRWNITARDSEEVDSNTDNAADETRDPSKPKPSAALPKLVIPDPDETSARKMR